MTEDEALAAEKEWIAKLGTMGDGGYNMCEGGRGATGMRLTDETRAKMSATAQATNRRPSALARARSAEVRAQGLSPEARANIAAGQQRRRAAEAAAGGVTAEFRERCSAAKRGRPMPRPSQGPRTAEVKAKISAANTGRRRTPEQRARIAAATKAAMDRLKAGGVPVGRQAHRAPSP